MERFADQDLGEAPRILVLGTGKLGNLVVLMPMLRGLKRRHPTSQLIYRGSERTRELEEACGWIDARLDPDDPLPMGVDLLINADAHEAASALLAAQVKPRFVVGPVVGLPPGTHPLQQLAVDSSWAQPDLAQRYEPWLQNTSIRALHCRTCWLPSHDAELVELPSTPPPVGVPAVLLAVNGERQAKLWPVEHWLELLLLLEKQLELQRKDFGLVGAPPTAEEVPQEQALVKAGVRDLRGKLTLPQVVGAYQRCRLAIAVDSGPMHLAAAARCPTVALFATDAHGLGASPKQLWAPRLPWVHSTETPVSCHGCRANNYRNDACVKPRHHCMEAISPQQVADLAMTAWKHDAA